MTFGGRVMTKESAYAHLIQRLGFVADPFAKTNADEEERLEHYFIEPPFYNAVLGDPASAQASIVFAPRGGGKTALKRKIELTSKDNSFMCVTYNRFPAPVSVAKDTTAEYHLTNILRLVLIAVISECHQWGVVRLSNEQRHLLYLFSKGYLSDLDRSELKEAIKAVKNLSDTALDWWNKFTGPVGLVVSALLAKVGLAHAEIKKFEEQGGSLGGFEEQFRTLRDIASLFGKRCVYVLVDRVDELPVTGSASASYDFIAPLLTDLHLLEQPGYGFKFFLWDLLLADYRAHARPDRIKYHILAWTHAQLQSMISERLRAHSDNKIRSLTELLEPNASLTFDRLVIYFALGSPRTIIRICKEIVDQQSEMNPSATKISVPAVFQGIEVFAANFANENVDPGILRDLKKVRRVNFTVRHVYSDVFKISQPAGISKVKQWQDAGIVERIGLVKETKGSRPSNLFSLTNPLIGKYIFKELSASEFMAQKLRVCDSCGALLIRDWERASEATCQQCDKSWTIPSPARAGTAPAS
jgi:hypothetical protein